MVKWEKILRDDKAIKADLACRNNKITLSELLEIYRRVQVKIYLEEKGAKNVESNAKQKVI